VRQATSADADAIGRVQVETWRTAYAGLLPQETIAAFDVSARQAMWREGLGRTPRPGSATFVAVVEDEIVGFATVGGSHSEDGTGEVYAIYVDPARWGHGAGRALIVRRGLPAGSRDSRRRCSGRSRGTSARSGSIEPPAGSATARRRTTSRGPRSRSCAIGSAFDAGAARTLERGQAAACPPPAVRCAEADTATGNRSRVGRAPALRLRN
jgi:GNAT superfamily N-acetyltransferase